MAQITSGITLTPTGYTNYGNYAFTASTSYPWTNAYEDSQSTTYAQLTLAKNNSNTRQSQVYLEFDTSQLDGIPSNATINSVQCHIKYYVSSTSYVTAFSARTYTNTTAKGTALTSRPTSANRSEITMGTWSLSELKNARIYIYPQRIVLRIVTHICICTELILQSTIHTKVMILLQLLTQIL